MSEPDGGHRPAHTVVVEDGRIQAVMPDAAYSTTGGLEIDAGGRWVVPGLADMHVHFDDAGEDALYLANGVTTVRNMFGTPWHLAYRAQVERGERIGPRIVAASPLIDGPMPGSGRPAWPGSALLEDEATAASLVQRFAARGYDQVKAYSFLSPASLTGLGRASKEFGLRLTGHCPDSVSYEEAIDAGQTCFEHLMNIARDHWRAGAPPAPPRSDPTAFSHHLREHLDDDALSVLAERLADLDVWNCVTSTVWYGFAAMFSPDAARDPHLAYLPSDMLTSWDPTNDFRFRSLPRESYEEFHRARTAIADRHQEVLTLLHEHGAPLLVGTDNPNPYVIPGFAIHDELANFVRSGIPVVEALHAATSAPARFLGEQGSSGCVHDGARADLLIVDGDPRIDLGVLRRPRFVLTNGFLLDEAKLVAMLEARRNDVASRAKSAELTPPELDSQRAEGRTGVLRSRLAGTPTGCCSYRHVPHDDGSIEVEEHHREGIVGSRRVRAVVDRRGVLDSASVHRTWDIGSTNTVVERHGRRYTVRIVDIDGWEETCDYDIGEARPSERLATSTLPLLLTGDESFVVLDDEGLAQATVSQDALLVERASETTTIEVDVSEDGRLCRATLDSWMGEITIEAE